MNELEFLEQYPKRRPDSCKSDNGRVLIIAGSPGMAGAAYLNLLGARCLGPGYLRAILPGSIYPIVASLDPRTVYYPDDIKPYPSLIKPGGINDLSDAIAFGSGMSNLPDKDACLRTLLGVSKVPTVIDAEGLRILANDPSLLRIRRQCQLILTPHLGEFAALTGQPADHLQKDRGRYAAEYAKANQVFLVLKGPHTLIVSPEGSCAENDSGNEGLAQAGSGDVLAGMIAAMAALNRDVFQAAAAAVWFHGHLADLAVLGHSIIGLDFRRFPELADQFFAGRR